MAGAPQSYTSKPGFPAPTATYTAAPAPAQAAPAPAAPSSPTPSSNFPQSQETQPPHIYYKEKKVKPPKPPKPPREPKSGSEEPNLFALLGISHAFFAPFLGLVLSIIGLVKSNYYGGKTTAIIGIVVGALLSIVAIVLIILMLVSDTFLIQINFL